MSFTRYQPIALDVANIEFADEYKAPMREPNVDHLVPITPTEAVHIWVKDRIRAVGLKNSLQVIIKDASIIGTDLPKTRGLKGFFTDDQDRRYDARLVVELRIYGDSAMSEASVTITANQSNTLNEGATLFERKAFFQRMVGTLMESTNAELERQIFTYFKNHISYAQTP